MWQQRCRRPFLRPPSSSFRGRVLLAGLVVLAGGSCEPGADAGNSFLIEGATVVDGTGAPAYLASVRVRGTQIEAVGELSPRRGETVVSAAGLVLAPGFIDTHSHHDGGLLAAPSAVAAVSQGITTIVAGQDGGSQHPLRDFFEDLEATPAAVNVASYVGHGTLRRQILNDDFRRAATDDELAAMEALLREEMAAGALGLSTGLEYDPGIYSTTAEVVALARVAGAEGGRYISHMRSEDRDFFLALEETIQIAEEARLPVQISHMKLAMRGLWGRAAEALELLDAARARGLDITADVYPYEYWQSTMTVLFPERDFTDRIAAEFALAELVAPEGMLIGDFAAEPALEGRTLAQVAQARGSDPVTTFMDLIAQSQDHANQTGSRGESIVATSMTANDIAELMAWEHTNVSSDGGLDGAHPRGFGTYPRVLGRYVREGGHLSLEGAVHKMTGLSAAHMGMKGRGEIRPGAAADLVAFDPDVVLDRATPAEPHLTATGIETVWVGGTVVYRGGSGATGALPGVVIRRES